MKPAPALLVGQVMHRRLRPVRHDFVYPVFFVRLPLRRLAAAECPLFTVDRGFLLAFHQADHGPRDGSPLLPWIEARLCAAGLPCDGEIVLQTFPRVFGFVFNPVSFWYCHDRDGALIAVLAEVNNTFGEHHEYLLHDAGRPLPSGVEFSAVKQLHVSPFNRVNGGYRFRFREHGQDGRAAAMVRLDYDDADGALLQTSISGRVQPWSSASLLRALLRMPFLTFGIVLRIHWQALRLWLKGVPFLGARPPAPSCEESRP